MRVISVNSIILKDVGLPEGILGDEKPKQKVKMVGITKPKIDLVGYGEVITYEQKYFLSRVVMTLCGMKDTIGGVFMGDEIIKLNKMIGVLFLKPQALKVGDDLYNISHGAILGVVLDGR